MDDLQPGDLVECIHNEMIVGVSGAYPFDFTGVVLYKGDSDFDTFSNITNCQKKNFRRFYGTVEISNVK